MLTINRCTSWVRAVVLTAILLIPAFSFISAQTCTWNPLGNQGFATSSSSLSMDVHPLTGEHYIAAKDGGTQKAAVWKLSGGTWTAVGPIGFSNFTINDIDLAINPVTGEPYVLLTINYQSDLKASVMRYNGSSWVLVGSEAFNAGSLGSDPSIVFHPITNEPYVAYGDGNQTERLRIKRFDGVSWVDFGTFPHSIFYAYFARLIFDPVDATPYVVFQNGVNVNSVFNDAISVVKYDA
ncbi:MAG: hypothetical protein KDC12_14925, partial [Flavobacteriales bacterium]|nr:hypothetical protein [Flavobacteriales bacterium]